MLVADGKISRIEWDIYQRAYQVMTCSLIPPSILVFLDVEPEIALERIRIRDRKAERGDLVPLEYLQRLQKGYFDLLSEIESNKHTWSRGMEVFRIPWNTDFQSIDKLIKIIAKSSEHI